jgi:hypothetical protein
MIYLPILINDRRWYVAPFVIESPSGAEVPTAEFVVALSQQNSATLFELNKEKSQIIRENGENIELEDVEFEKEKLEGGKKALFLYSYQSHIDYCFEKTNNEDSFKIDYKLPFPKDSSHKMDLKITIEGVSYITSLVFHVSKYQNMFEAVIDFGSEASQMLIKSNDEPTGKLVDMLQNLVAFHAENEEYKDIHKDFNKERDQMQQHDMDNNYFYKSNFYVVNKRVEGSEEKINYFSTDNSQNDYTNEPFSKADEPVKVCFNLLEQDDFHKDSFAIPNLKVLEKCPWVYDKHNVSIKSIFKGITRTSLKNFSDEDVRNNVMREIINNFSHVLLKEAIEKIIEKQIEDKINIQFKFFVPNIYTYEKSLKLLKLIHDDLKIIVKNNYIPIKEDANNFQRIKISDFINEIELSIISESDASFLGLFKNLEITSKINTINNTGKKVLLIDCGKGTTDISILEMIDGKPIANYRNGIAGAGNFISFGFLEAILKQTKIENKEQFLQKLKELISYTGNTKGFIDIVEQFKRAYSNENNKIDLGTIQIDLGSGPKNLNTLDLFTSLGLSLNNLVEIIEPYSNSKLLNIEHIIDKYTSELCDEIINNIEQSGIDFRKIELVLLTGRGFLFKPLYNKIETTLEDKIRPNKGLLNFNRTKISEIIPDLGKRINLKNICLYGGLNMKGQYISDNPTFDIKTIAPDSFLGSLNIIQNRKTRTWSHQNLESLESIMLTGVTIENKNSATGLLNIGGEDFSFDTRDVSETMNLYFAGSINNEKHPYLLKCSDSNKKIELSKSHTSRDHVNDKFALKTLFPHINPEEINTKNGFTFKPNPISTTSTTTKKFIL